MSRSTWAGLCAAAVLATGCTSVGAQADSDLPEVVLVAGGVLRVHLHTGQEADLSVRLVSDDETKTLPEPDCLVPRGPQDSSFTLNWRAVSATQDLPDVVVGLLDEHGVPLSADDTCRSTSALDLGETGQGEQLVLPALLRAGAGALRPQVLDVRIGGTTVRLRLVPACGPAGQDATRTCTLDPLQYDPDTAWSASLSA